MPNTSSASACDVKYLGPGIGTIGDEDGICHDLVTLDQCIDTGIEYIQVHHATRVDAVRMKCVGGVSLEGEVVGEVNDFYSLPCKDADPPGIANISASLMSYEDDARQYPFDMVVTCVDGSQFGPYGDGDAVNGR